MDLFSNDYQVALEENEHALAVASQDSAGGRATGTDFQPCLQKLNQGQQIASGERTVSILSYGQCPSIYMRDCLLPAAYRQSLLTSAGQMSKEPS